MARVLLTGAAGFIGFHVAERLLRRGDEVIGVDNLSDYYDVNLKRARLDRLSGRLGFSFRCLDLALRPQTQDLFLDLRPERVVHLAAQAGVRYSLTNPHVYADSNLVGFLNVLEGCRHGNVQHLVYASSSSVYGANTRMPFSVHDNVDHPVSLYAATKKANELMAHSYSWLYGIPTTGLRFFTVYGPWGRPDMAIFLFTKSILEGRPIELFNEGRMQRDFTYIDDIAEGVVRTLDHVPLPDRLAADDRPDPSTSRAPTASTTSATTSRWSCCESSSCWKAAWASAAERTYLPMQPGDVPATYADVDDLCRDVGFRPATPIEEGIARFVAWYREYYGQPAVIS